MPRYVVTGAPGTGKTTLLELLADHFTIVPEPAREVLAEHAETTSEATLDHRPRLFVERLIERSIRNHEEALDSAITIFDRGLPDCAAYADVFGLDPEPVIDLASGYRYESPVLMTRPWREIYTTDELRRATFSQIEMFQSSLERVYSRLDYEIVVVPNVSPAERASFIRERLTHPSGG